MSTLLYNQIKNIKMKTKNNKTSLAKCSRTQPYSGLVSTEWTPISYIGKLSLKSLSFGPFNSCPFIIIIPTDQITCHFIYMADDMEALTGHFKKSYL